MKTIAFLVDKEHRNSIIGYALTVFDVLKQSKKFNYQLHSVPFDKRTPDQHASEWLNNLQADAIIYNWYPGRDNWLFEDLMRLVGKPQFVIGGHHHMPEFATPKHQWSVFIDAEHTDRVTPLPRPIVTYPDLVYAPPTGRIKIGSFGLGSKIKNYPKLVEMVNTQFNDVVVDLNLHMSYTPQSVAETNSEAQKCRDVVMPNVNLNLTFNYLKTSYDVAKFLNGNDLNVFIYDDEPHLKVTSSSLDHALSARKPIALSRSSYFSHMHHVPGIWVEERGLRDIMNDGIAPLEPVYQQHSVEHFLESVEPYIERYL